MHIKVWIISFLLLATPCAVFAQLQPEGEWELDKVNVKLFSDPGNNLLEERTQDSLPLQAILTGKRITFYGQNYIMQGAQGTYLLLSDGSLAFRNAGKPVTLINGQPQPDVFCKVKMPDADRLIIELPVEVYKDHSRNLIIKQFFICQYNRKK
ncbi:hypothetical protein [Chitinophaga niabensis]|uniref:DUF4488 domain-containing protein n=1 Tax=Chitinophaga niabensis TaxID=536979 RepID=A0A1N6DEG7_9BACT|nr:hypothetical protein [Chitinophaga niabensis]SIN69182.1 hypothetical protein SAMN04488055_0667 [Chitinophaga niabensis]